MDIQNLTNENKVFIRTLYKEMRDATTSFMSDRDFNMSNAQMFAFLSYAPIALAIASDGVVDEKEIAMLEKFAKTIDVKAMVNLELQEMMAIAFEPESPMTNEEFNLRIGAEILYLSRNMKKYEADFIRAVKALLTFDFNPKADGSMTQSFSKLMDSVIEKNAGRDKENELKNMLEFKKKLGIVAQF